MWPMEFIAYNPSVKTDGNKNDTNI